MWGKVTHRAPGWGPADTSRKIPVLPPLSRDDEYCGTRFQSSRREARSIGTQPSNLVSVPYRALRSRIGPETLPRCRPVQPSGPLLPHGAAECAEAQSRARKEPPGWAPVGPRSPPAGLHTIDFREIDVDGEGDGQLQLFVVNPGEPVGLWSPGPARRCAPPGGPARPPSRPARSAGCPRRRTYGAWCHGPGPRSPAGRTSTASGTSAASYRVCRKPRSASAHHQDIGLRSVAGPQHDVISRRTRNSSGTALRSPDSSRYIAGA